MEVIASIIGNESAEKNVTYTKASIYAIRFAFNSIYAFTDSEIRRLSEIRKKRELKRFWKSF